MLLRPVQEMLRQEIKIWGESDEFAERKGARQRDEAFKFMHQTLREYHELDELYANALSKVCVDFSRQGMAENAEVKRCIEETLGRSRTKLQWSGLGLLAATLGLPCCGLYLCWQRRQSKLPDKAIIVPDQTGA
jgi:hypothetical protein